MSGNNHFTITGTVHSIGAIQTFPSGFSKRQFVLQVEDGKYPQTVPFELFKEHTDRIDSFRVGDAIEVHFNLRGNENNGRFYGSNCAWKLLRLGGIAEHRENQSPLEKLREMIVETGIAEKYFDQAVAQAYAGKISAVSRLGETHLIRYCEPHVFAKIYDAAQKLAEAAEPDLADEDLAF